MPTTHHSDSIRIKGARQHNLKNLSLEIPRNRLVVITGLSGSGKSSLAFDTIYAEGQRRYVESLSVHARQFLDRLQKPDVDFIEGLSPAIAIEQRTSAANPRSTIATTTEIYDYLRLLFAAVGQPHDPSTGAPVKRQTPQEITDTILSWPDGTRLILLAPLVKNEKGEFRDVIEKARREGFVRLRIDRQIIELSPTSIPRPDKNQTHNIEAVIDRLVIRDGIRTRLSDSIEMALQWGNGTLIAARSADSSTWLDEPFSTHYCNPATGFSMPELTPRHFSFNSHLGACPSCHGLGSELRFDPSLLIDPEKSLDQGAIKPWQTGNSKLRTLYSSLLDALVAHHPVSRSSPWKNLPTSFHNLILHGSQEVEIEFKIGQNKISRRPFEGLIAQLEKLLSTTKSQLTKKRLRQFQNRYPCRTCNGTRLKPEILAVTIPTSQGKHLNIHQLCSLPIHEAITTLQSLSLSSSQLTIVSDVIREIHQRLKFLDDVGLGYLQLSRESGSLSGGEAQRIRLATQIGSGLAGVLYVLDEPSIGLHQRDNERLITTLRTLRDLGNSVIVVEHDEETIRAADHIIDMGPGAGPRGGEIVAQGTLQQILQNHHSLTASYLSGRLRINTPKQRVPPKSPLNKKTDTPSEGWLIVEGARENNLKNITAAFPIGCLTCVTGVSGSGKSTLVNNILRASLSRDLNGSKESPGLHSRILGANQLDKVIVIDQSPIGRTPRSNPATYSGAMAPIRDLFSELPAARVRGYDASRFSLNTKGGRCEHCQGNGLIKIEMQFLADIYVECEVCRGKRFNRETLEITYKGKNIADVLDMTIDDAARFFRNIPQLANKFTTLQDVGLGYLRLGQSATTLSGGEAQRLKLAAELARRPTGRTLYILDEPTTGLHFADIHKLLEVLLKLRDAQNTLIIIEHNLDVVKCADWVIDLGPEGGNSGGFIVASGTPETIAAHPKSITGKFLSRYL